MEAFGFYFGNRQPRVFQHAPHGYPAEVMAMAGIWHIPARALIFSQPGDTVCVHPDLIDEVPYILTHYRELGLCVTSDIVPSFAYGEPGIPNAAVLDTFLWSAEANVAAPDQTRLTATSQYNDKNWFMQNCTLHGVPVPPYRRYAARQIPQRLDLRYPVFVKAAVSGSGKHVIECHNLTQVQAAAAAMPGDYQVQEAVPNLIAALNVLYFIEDTGAARFVCTTEQILDGTAHNGNRYPSRHDPRSVTEDIARRAGEDGVRGLCGFDVLVSQTHGSQMVECNPRPNGSSYYAVAAYRLGVQSPWQGVGLATKHRSLAQVDLSGLGYNPARGSGAVLVGWGSIVVGGLGFLIAGSPDEQAQLLLELQSRL